MSLQDFYLFWKIGMVLSFLIVIYKLIYKTSKFKNAMQEFTEISGHRYFSYALMIIAEILIIASSWIFVVQAISAYINKEEDDDKN